MEYQKCAIYNHETVRRIDDDAEVCIKTSERDGDIYNEEYHFKSEKIMPDDLYISCDIGDTTVILLMVEEDGVRFGRPLKKKKI